MGFAPHHRQLSWGENSVDSGVFPDRLGSGFTHLMMLNYLMGFLAHGICFVG